MRVAGCLRVTVWPEPSVTVMGPAAAGPITVTDGSGQTVTLKQPATRIVSLAPANTEIAFAVGAGDKMVAGTSYDDYPAAAKSLPKIGDFANPNVEKIASFNPDLVLAAGGLPRDLQQAAHDRRRRHLHRRHDHSGRRLEPRRHRRKRLPHLQHRGAV